LNPLARATVFVLEWTLTLFFFINWLIVGMINKIAPWDYAVNILLKILKCKPGN
jgi:hypothetical protein